MKTIIFNRDAKFEIFVRGFMARQDYFTYFEQSRTLCGIQSGLSPFRFFLGRNTIFTFSVTTINNYFHSCGQKLQHLKGPCICKNFHIPCNTSTEISLFEHPPASSTKHFLHETKTADCSRKLLRIKYLLRYSQSNQTMWTNKIWMNSCI